MKKGYSLLAGSSALLALAVLHRYLCQWGSRPAERRYRQHPDPGLTTASVSTRAITIQASTEQVFAWLQQMGYQRAGFYSYQRLERLLGLAIVNAEQIEPQWQQVSVGDRIAITPVLVATVQTYQAGRNLTLVFADRWLRFEWSFLLSTLQQPEQSTRLIVQTSAVGSVLPLSIWRYLMAPLHAVMEIGLLKGIKQRAER